MDALVEMEVDQLRRCTQGRHVELVQGQCPACLEFDCED